MMTRPGLWTAIVVVAACACAAQASIVTWQCQDDGDGAIVMNSKSWDSGTSTLQLVFQQKAYPGHISGNFGTDTELDPTVWMIESVDNSTGFDWTSYRIAIGMDKAFSIIGVVAPPDWTWAISPPAGGQPLPGDPSPGTGWVGTLDYYAGTPIAPGGTGQFGLVVQFTGSVAFSTEQVPIPEPATLALLGLGGLALVRRRRRA